MQVDVGDRLVIHGKRGTRIGVVTEVSESGWTVRWADGDAPSAQAAWEAAKAGPPVSWRRGITAGVGHEASLRQRKLAKEITAEPEAEVEDGHEPAVGE